MIVPAVGYAVVVLVREGNVAVQFCPTFADATMAALDAHKAIPEWQVINIMRAAHVPRVLAGLRVARVTDDPADAADPANFRLPT